MEIVTKRDMFDAEALLEVLANAEDGTLIRDFVHDVAQAIADGRRPEEPRLPIARPCPACDGVYAHAFNCALNQRS